MIRIAFFAVFAAAGVLAIAGFSVMRNTGQTADPPVIAANPPPVLETEEAPVAPIEKLFFLRDIDLSEGQITLVLFGAEPDRSIRAIRDQPTLIAAHSIAYLSAEFFAMQNEPAPSQSVSPRTVMQIYRDDALIAAIDCIAALCDGPGDTASAVRTPLWQTAIPIARVEEVFETYDTYLASIDAIAQDPDFMLLHARPTEGFPAARRPPSLRLQLPTVVAASGAPLDFEAHEARVRDALTPLLPDGATLEQVTISAPGVAVLGDRDNNRAVLASGAVIPFMQALYYQVTAHILGTTALPQDALDTLTSDTRVQHDTDQAFARFLNANVGAAVCTDCYFLKVDGNVHDTARVLEAGPETYTLSYFDLRDPP